MALILLLLFGINLISYWEIKYEKWLKEEYKQVLLDVKFYNYLDKLIEIYHGPNIIKSPTK